MVLAKIINGVSIRAVLQQKICVLELAVPVQIFYVEKHIYYATI